MRMTTRDTRTPRPALTKEIPRVGGDSVVNHGGGLSGSLKFHFCFLIIWGCWIYRCCFAGLTVECKCDAKRVLGRTCKAGNGVVLLYKNYSLQQGATARKEQDIQPTYNRNRVFIGQE